MGLHIDRVEGNDLSIGDSRPVLKVSQIFPASVFSKIFTDSWVMVTKQLINFKKWLMNKKPMILRGLDVRTIVNVPTINFIFRH